MFEENTEKMNFFNRIVTSIKDFDKYQIFAVEKTSTAIKYLCLILIIFSIIISCSFTYELNQFLDRGKSFFNENIDDIYYKDGELDVNGGKEVIFYTDLDILPTIHINTNEENIDNIGDDEGIILLKNKMIIKNDAIGQNIEYNYNDLLEAYEITEFDKNAVIDFAKNFNMSKLYINFIFITSIYLFILYFISTLMDVIMLAVLGYILARMISIRLKFKATFNMAIYALTLPIILNLIYIVVNTFTGFYVKYFQWMYTTISYIYMLVAILIIKADFINKKMELMKIIQEQERVRKQIDEKTNDKEEKEPDDDKDKEKEDKKKKKETDDKGIDDNGLAPQE